MNPEADQFKRGMRDDTPQASRAYFAGGPLDDPVALVAARQVERFQLRVHRDFLTLFYPGPDGSKLCRGVGGKRFGPKAIRFKRASASKYRWQC
jgi:hypothetical protein